MKVMFLLIALMSSYLFIQCGGASTNDTAEGSTEQAEFVQLENKHKEVINEVVAEIESADFKALAKRFEYPFYRRQTKDTIQETFMPYNLAVFFDDEYRTQIVNSAIDDYWFLNRTGDIVYGEFDFVMTETGQFKSLNRLSFSDQIIIAEKKDLEAEKMQLHDSVKVFRESIIQVQTDNYKIRIDQLADNSYRYAAWPIEAPFTTMPTVLIQNGYIERMGTVNNYDYTFIKDNYKYVYSENNVGERGIPIGALMIYAGDKEILYEEAIPPSFEDFWDEFMQHTEDKVYLARHIRFPYFIYDREVTYSQFFRTDFDLESFADMNERNTEPYCESFNWSRTDEMYNNVINYSSSNHVYKVSTEPGDMPEGIDAYFVLENSRFYFIGFCYMTYEVEEEVGC